MKEVKCKHCGYWTSADALKCNYCSSTISVPKAHINATVNGMDSGNSEKVKETWWIRILKWAVGKGGSM